MTAETESKLFFASEALKLFLGDAFFELAPELSAQISHRAYVKNLAEALHTEAVRYKLMLRREVKTEIPVKILARLF